jgi:hypothetical protein
MEPRNPWPVSRVTVGIAAGRPGTKMLAVLARAVSGAPVAISTGPISAIERIWTAGKPSGRFSPTRHLFRARRTREGRDLYQNAQRGPRVSWSAIPTACASKIEPITCKARQSEYNRLRSLSAGAVTKMGPNRRLSQEVL